MARLLRPGTAALRHYFFTRSFRGKSGAGWPIWWPSGSPPHLTVATVSFEEPRFSCSRIFAELSVRTGERRIAITLPSSVILYRTWSRRVAWAGSFASLKGAVWSTYWFPRLIIFQIVMSRSEEHTSELQSPCNLVCRPLLVNKNSEHLIRVP